MSWIIQLTNELTACDERLGERNNINGDDDRLRETTMRNVASQCLNKCAARISSSNSNNRHNNSYSATAAPTLLHLSINEACEFALHKFPLDIYTLDPRIVIDDSDIFFTADSAAAPTTTTTTNTSAATQNALAKLNTTLAEQIGNGSLYLLVPPSQRWCKLAPHLFPDVKRHIAQQQQHATHQQLEPVTQMWAALFAAYSTLLLSRTREHDEEQTPHDVHGLEAIRRCAWLMCSFLAAALEHDDAGDCAVLSVSNLVIPCLGALMVRLLRCTVLHASSSSSDFSKHDDFIFTWFLLRELAAAAGKDSTRRTAEEVAIRIAMWIVTSLITAPTTTTAIASCNVADSVVCSLFQVAWDIGGSDSGGISKQKRRELVWTPLLATCRRLLAISSSSSHHLVRRLCCDILVPCCCNNWQSDQEEGDDDDALLCRKADIVETVLWMSKRNQDTEIVALQVFVKCEFVNSIELALLAANGVSRQLQQHQHEEHQSAVPFFEFLAAANSTFHRAMKTARIECCIDLRACTVLVALQGILSFCCATTSSPQQIAVFLNAIAASNTVGFDEIQEVIECVDASKGARSGGDTPFRHNEILSRVQRACGGESLTSLLHRCVAAPLTLQQHRISSNSLAPSVAAFVQFLHLDHRPSLNMKRSGGNNSAPNVEAPPPSSSTVPQLLLSRVLQAAAAANDKQEVIVELSQPMFDALCVEICHARDTSVALSAVIQRLVLPLVRTANWIRLQKIVEACASSVSATSAVAVHADSAASTASSATTAFLLRHILPELMIVAVAPLRSKLCQQSGSSPAASAAAPASSPAQTFAALRSIFESMTTLLLLLPVAVPANSSNNNNNSRTPFFEFIDDVFAPFAFSGGENNTNSSNSSLNSNHTLATIIVSGIAAGLMKQQNTISSNNSAFNKDKKTFINAAIGMLASRMQEGTTEGALLLDFELPRGDTSRRVDNSSFLEHRREYQFRIAVTLHLVVSLAASATEQQAADESRALVVDFVTNYPAAVDHTLEWFRSGAGSSSSSSAITSQLCFEVLLLLSQLPPQALFSWVSPCLHQRNNEDDAMTAVRATYRANLLAFLCSSQQHRSKASRSQLFNTIDRIAQSVGFAAAEGTQQQQQRLQRMSAVHGDVFACLAGSALLLHRSSVQPPPSTTNNSALFSEWAQSMRHDLAVFFSLQPTADVISNHEHIQALAALQPLLSRNGSDSSDDNQNGAPAVLLLLRPVLGLLSRLSSLSLEAAQAAARTQEASLSGPRPSGVSLVSHHQMIPAADAAAALDDDLKIDLRAALTRKSTATTTTSTTAQHPLPRNSTNTAITTTTNHNSSNIATQLRNQRKFDANAFETTLFLRATVLLDQLPRPAVVPTKTLSDIGEIHAATQNLLFTPTIGTLAMILGCTSHPSLQQLGTAWLVACPKDEQQHQQEQQHQKRVLRTFGLCNEFLRACRELSVNGGHPYSFRNSSSNINNSVIHSTVLAAGIVPSNIFFQRLLPSLAQPSLVNHVPFPEILAALAPLQQFVIHPAHCLRCGMPHNEQHERQQDRQQLWTPQPQQQNTPTTMQESFARLRQFTSTNTNRQHRDLVRSMKNRMRLWNAATFDPIQLVDGRAATALRTHWRFELDQFFSAQRHDASSVSSPVSLLLHIALDAAAPPATTLQQTLSLVPVLVSSGEIDKAVLVLSHTLQQPHNSSAPPELVIPTMATLAAATKLRQEFVLSTEQHLQQHGFTINETVPLARSLLGRSKLFFECSRRLLLDGGAAAQPQQEAWPAVCVAMKWQRTFADQMIEAGEEQLRGFHRAQQQHQHQQRRRHQHDQPIRREPCVPTLEDISQTNNDSIAFFARCGASLLQIVTSKLDTKKKTTTTTSLHCPLLAKTLQRASFCIATALSAVASFTSSCNSNNNINHNNHVALLFCSLLRVTLELHAAMLLTPAAASDIDGPTRHRNDPSSIYHLSASSSSSLPPLHTVLPPVLQLWHKIPPVFVTLLAQTLVQDRICAETNADFEVCLQPSPAMVLISEEVLLPLRRFAHDLTRCCHIGLGTAAYPLMQICPATTSGQHITHFSTPWSGILASTLNNQQAKTRRESSASAAMRIESDFQRLVSGLLLLPSFSSSSSSLASYAAANEAARRTVAEEQRRRQRVNSNIGRGGHRQQRVNDDDDDADGSNADEPEIEVTEEEAAATLEYFRREVHCSADLIVAHHAVRETDKMIWKVLQRADGTRVSVYVVFTSLLLPTTTTTATTLDQSHFSDSIDDSVRRASLWHQVLDAVMTANSNQGGGDVDVGVFSSTMPRFFQVAANSWCIIADDERDHHQHSCAMYDQSSSFHSPTRLEPLGVALGYNSAALNAMPAQFVHLQAFHHAAPADDAQRGSSASSASSGSSASSTFADAWTTMRRDVLGSPAGFFHNGDASALHIQRTKQRISDTAVALAVSAELAADCGIALESRQTLVVTRQHGAANSDAGSFKMFVGVSRAGSVASSLFKSSIRVPLSKFHVGYSVAEALGIANRSNNINGQALFELNAKRRRILEHQQQHCHSTTVMDAVSRLIFSTELLPLDESDDDDDDEENDADRGGGGGHSVRRRLQKRQLQEQGGSVVRCLLGDPERSAIADVRADFLSWL